MKKMKQLTAALLALAMALGLAACNPSGSTPSGAPENSGTPEQSAPPAVQSADLEELGSGDVKWKEETTADGWVKITNEGGAVLGYSKDSGVALLQSGGYAFKDLNRNGALDPYEDWRLDYETRARDLASQMSGEQIAPYLTHGGWGTFTTDKNVFTSADNAGYLRTVTGEHEPSGLLIAQMPASMEAVEAQADDLPRDMECYVDADGNVYDFAYGLNWSGKIDDQRVKTYSAEPLTECENLDFKYANQ